MKPALTLPALLALLVGCGGRPAPAPEPVAGGLRWTAVYGGAWVATCVLGDGFYGLRAGGLDVWTVPAQGPPKRGPSLALPWPAAGSPARTLGCPPGGDAPLIVHLSDGAAVSPDDAGWVRVDNPPLAGEPAAEWSGPINGRAVRLDRRGWALVRQGVAVAGRRTAGDFADATWDGMSGTLWVVGPTGLWRWRLEDPRMTFVPLPDNAPRALMRVWRDGPFLWVVDDSRIGYALDLKDGMARLVRRPGPVRLTGPERMALVGGRRVSVELGGEAMVVDGQTVALGARVDAFTPLGGAEVLLGLGPAIERWRVIGEPQRVERWTVGDRTRRIIVSGSRVFAVGGYGVLIGAAELPDRPPRSTSIGTVVVE